VRVVVHERAGGRFVECAAPIDAAGDVLDLIGACHEHDADRILVDAALLPPAFFELRTRFAGEFLQKLANYGFRIAIVFPADALTAHGARFGEFLAEAKNGRGFRAFTERAVAEAWLGAS
jgi:hypothetical protein